MPLFYFGWGSAVTPPSLTVPQKPGSAAMIKTQGRAFGSMKYIFSLEISLLPCRTSCELVCM